MDLRKDHEGQEAGKQPLGNINETRALQCAGKGNAAAVAELKARADRHALDMLPIVDDIRTAGITTLEGIATELNSRGVLTARKRKWYATTVRNLLARSGRLPREAD